MTFGQKIKSLRIKANLTQKDLADKMNVTFQTVSKWESDTNEPDIASIKELAKIFGCSFEYLFNDEEEQISNQEQEISKETIAEKPKVLIATCKECGKTIYQGETTHNIQQSTPGGMKEMVIICDECFTRHEKEEEKRIAEINDSLAQLETKKEKKGIQNALVKKDGKAFVAAIVIGIIVFIVTLVLCIQNYQQLGLGASIAIPIAACYCIIADIYCIFTFSFIGEIFVGIASKTFKFPMLIFSWNLDGIAWLISMKILFGILGFIFSACVFLFALGVCTIFSVVCFIPMLIANRTH